ncbi:BZ3500_MvSof-1268-A1-R1_Chr8-1g09971 [Microbotryum saponariae]|uniref:Protein PNS1 n=1 Tax=Microbotryum saponariae TaxID=289078 RepID=A0A2X0LAU1_9BASI|nr:BZ3500_MvSof-1268-A1-R1_Chr8-1g09971 [Microbotryum saponariae]SDA08257.1 BZ3501_MvSof-1269-A2-R1_Chr8-1g09694 [Microbotryum saponariae]
MQGFASYASHLLASTSAGPSQGLSAYIGGGAHPSASSATPMFYSTRDSYIPFDESDDILGASSSTQGDDARGRYDNTRTGLSFGGSVDGGSTSTDTRDDHHHDRTRTPAVASLGDSHGHHHRNHTVQGDDDDDDNPYRRDPSVTTATSSSNAAGAAPSSMLGLDLPAFVSRINPANAARGWRAHESVQHPPPHRYYPEQDDLSEEDEGPLDYIEDADEEDEDASPPGAFLSTPSPPFSSGGAEPLLAQRTLFLYPVRGRTEGVRANGEYRDSQWIVAYGVCVLAVFVLGLLGWWETPIKDTPSYPAYSIFNTIPVLLTLSFVSLLAGVSSATYILAVRHGMRHFINAALIAGPLLFIGAGVLSFGGSFGGIGAAGDKGWKTGMRWFAVACFVWAYVLGRAAVSRRKQVARAIALGELATQIILEHPPLILLCFGLSVLSAVVALPCFVLVANQLFDSSVSSSWLPGWGSIVTLLVFAWSLAILRGVQHAIVGGVVGAYYFERQQAEYPGPVVVTKAALQRATHGSLGTIIFASAITSLATSTTSLLKRAQTVLRSKHLHPIFQPLTYLVPLMGIVTSFISSFNGYALSYAGMTGEPYLQSAREVAKMVRQNKTSALGDSLLVRLVLFVVSFGFGLLAGLVAFLVASSRLASGVHMTPFVAALCYFVPVWTLKLCHDVCGDTVDALFLCLNIDLVKGENHSEETRTAFKTEASEPSFV